MTAHYPAALIESKGYTGFSALYGDTITATRAGMHWDRVLMDYCSGRGAEPVWGIAGSDFHGEKDGVGLDSYQTVFLVEGRLSATDGGHYSVAVSIIRGGKPIWSFDGQTQCARGLSAFGRFIRLWRVHTSPSANKPNNYTNKKVSN